MQQSITLEPLRIANSRRSLESFRAHHAWSSTDWACALAGETGKACSLIRRRREGEIIDLNQIGDQLADIIILTDILAERLTIDLQTAVRRKFNATSEKVGSAETL